MTPISLKILDHDSRFVWLACDYPNLDNDDLCTVIIGKARQQLLTLGWGVMMTPTVKGLIPEIYFKSAGENEYACFKLIRKDGAEVTQEDVALLKLVYGNLKV